jgi:hypothetical protein
LIHNPESILFAWGQDEEEGALYNITRDDKFNLYINKIACANLNNEAQVRLDGLNSSIRGGVFNISGIGDVRFNISETFDSNDDNLIDIESVEIAERTRDLEVDYISVAGQSRLSFSVPIEQKDAFLSVLNGTTSSYFEKLINDIPTEESRKAYSLLSRLSECSYWQIKTVDRVKYLEWLTGEFNMNEDQEFMLINLLTYNNDKSGLFQALYDKPLIVEIIVSKCNGNRKQIVLDELIKLCNETWSDNTPKGVIYTGKTTVDIGNDKHEADYITFAKQIDGGKTLEVQNYKGIFKGGSFNIGQVQEYPPIVKFNCNLLDPVCVYVDDKPYILPLIFPAQLSEQLGNKAVFNQLVTSVVDIALIYGGTKLVSALAPEAKMIIDYLKITPRSFATLFLTDVGLQVSTNYLIDQNWENALGQVDLFDAAFTGTIGNIASIPVKGSQLLHLAKYGKQFSICRQITTNTTKVVTIEFTKIAFDYKLAENDFKILCDNNEEYYDVMTKLILSLAAHYTAEEIHGFLKGWNNKVVESIEVEFDQIARPILLKVNEVVQTETFGKIIGAGAGVIAKFIEQINQEAAEVECKIIEIEDIDKCINDIESIKQDNTNVILPLTE